MFVEHKEQGEAAPVKVGTLKLSEAIRECGAGNVMSYDDCVLGRAYRKLTGRSLKDDGDRATHFHTFVYSDLAADAFGVPREIADRAEQMCLGFRGKSPAQIADWLECKGY